MQVMEVEKQKNCLLKLIFAFGSNKAPLSTHYEDVLHTSLPTTSRKAGLKLTVTGFACERAEGRCRLKNVNTVDTLLWEDKKGKQDFFFSKQPCY